MLSDDEFRILLQHYDRPWSGYRKIRKGVKKRIRRHMELLDCATVDAYLQVLKDQPDQEAECRKNLLVTISRFWRDRRLWEYLQHHLLPAISHSYTPPIRAWSAGCACGEEPYSLAMAWASQSDTISLRVLATDTQAPCLDRAANGLYGASSLKELPEELHSTYFVQHSGRRQWRILSSKLPQIEWRQHQLFDPPPQESFHLIFLRNNLLTYHHGQRLQLALESILSALMPGGWLVVGSHETPPTAFTDLVRNPTCPWIYQLSP